MNTSFSMENPRQMILRSKYFWGIKKMLGKWKRLCYTLIVVQKRKV